MTNLILKELEKNLNNLKVSVVNGSYSDKQATIEFNKIIFAANTLLRALKKQELSNENVSKDMASVIAFTQKLSELRSKHKEIFNDVDLVENMTEDLKSHLPDRIHTDSEDELEV